MRVILVPVAGRPESAIALDNAFRLAQELDANVVGCHVRPHRHSQAPLATGEFWSLDESALKTDASPRRSEAARKAANRLFVERAAAAKLDIRKKPSLTRLRSAHWEEIVGSPARVMAIVGPMSDLLVLTRPKNAGSAKATAFLLAAVLHSARPVLVLPNSKRVTPGKSIAIAWNQSTEAARAVTASLPLLRNADTVTIVTCGKEDRPGPKSTHLARYLRHWGIRAKILRKQGSETPEVVDAACAETDADLVVMGAYARGRMRERLFGGVTEHMLFHSHRAIFVLHS